MQHIDREQGDRRTQVKQPTSPGGIEHLLRLAQVSVKNSDIVLASQQLIALRHNPRVYIYIHHATTRLEILRHLMHVARGRQARSEIQELPHAHPPDTAPHNPVTPVDAYHVHQMRCPLYRARTRHPYGDLVFRCIPVIMT